MPKQPTSPRAPRHQPEPDDKFLFTVEQIALWGRTHARLLVIVGVVLLIAVAGGVWYVDSQRRLEAEATTRLSEIQQTVLTGNIPLAIRDLQTYIGTFGGTRPANEARLLLADLLLGQQRPAEAIQALGRAPRDLDEPVGIAAAQVLAAAYEALEQYDDALDTYRTIARNARFQFQQREALMDAGRLAMAIGRPEIAADLYDRLVQTFEPTEAGRGYSEMLREEARVMASAPPVAPDTGEPDPVDVPEAQEQ